MAHSERAEQELDDAAACTYREDGDSHIARAQVRDLRSHL